METWAVVFLGVIALAQTLMLVGVTWGGLRLVRRVDQIQRQLDDDLRPALETFNRVARNVGEISDRATLQARRLDLALSDAIGQVEATVGSLRRATRESLAPLFDVAAFVRGIRRGIDVYYQLRGFERTRGGNGRRYAEDDEHLFI